MFYLTRKSTMKQNNGKVENILWEMFGFQFSINWCKYKSI